MRRALPTPLALPFVLLATCTPTAAAAPERILFPVLGGADHYGDDYGDPRGQGSHEGNDLMAPRGRPVIAVAAGVVKLHHSPRSGPMLYLRSRTREFVYIHLNNDRTSGNDNTGGPETAFAPGLRSGSRVRAGQVIGYVGNSGDADSTPPHLHFEMRSHGGGPVNPYRHLRAARVVFVPVAPRPPADRLIAAAAPAGIRLTLVGRLAWTSPGPDGGRVAVRVRRVVTDVPGCRPIGVRRLVVLRSTPAAAAGLAGVAPGSAVRVTTAPEEPTVARRQLFPATWSAEMVAAG